MPLSQLYEHITFQLPGCCLNTQENQKQNKQASDPPGVIHFRSGSHCPDFSGLSLELCGCRAACGPSEPPAPRAATDMAVAPEPQEIRGTASGSGLVTVQLESMHPPALKTSDSFYLRYSKYNLGRGRRWLSG